MAIKSETAQLQKGKQTERNAFPSVKLRFPSQGRGGLGSDIYTAESAPCSAPGAASLPAQGHLHHRHLSGWLLLQMAAWGLTFHGVAAAEHTCGTADVPSTLWVRAALGHSFGPGALHILQALAAERKVGVDLPTL